METANLWLPQSDHDLLWHSRAKEMQKFERISPQAIKEGGEITVATPQSIDRVKAELRKKISSGEYTVGQQIASKKVSKLIKL